MVETMSAGLGRNLLMPVLLFSLPISACPGASGAAPYLPELKEAYPGMTDPSRQAALETARAWLKAEDKRQAELEAERQKAEQQSIEEQIAETQARIAAADRILARERRLREREEAEERAEALRHPTPAEEWNARSGLLAQQLGLHPSQVPDGHVDYLFERLGTAFMLGVRQALSWLERG